MMRIAANFAMTLYMIGALLVGPGKPFATVLDIVFLIGWIGVTSLLFARLDVAARTRLGGMLFRDVRVIHDVLRSLLYAVGLLLMPWIPAEATNIWIWGVIGWIVVALVTLAVRRVRGAMPSKA